MNLEPVIRVKLVRKINKYYIVSHTYSQGRNRDTDTEYRLVAFIVGWRRILALGGKGMALGRSPLPSGCFPQRSRASRSKHISLVQKGAHGRYLPQLRWSCLV